MCLDDQRPVNRSCLLAAALLLAIVGLAGCANDGGTPPPPGANMGSAPGTSPSPASTSLPSAPPAEPSAAVLADGRHPVFVTGLDVAGTKVTFDLVQFLTGDAAKQAWVKEHPEEPDGPPNDYFIVNDNPRLRTLPVSGAVSVKVVDMSAPGVPLTPIAFADLPGFFTTASAQEGNKLWHNPFWLTVTSGAVVTMEEQYLP